MSNSNPLSIGDINAKIAPIDMKLTPTIGDVKPEAGGSFASMLAKAMNASNDAQWAAGLNTEDLVTGKMKSTHEMAILGAKAEVMLHITTQIASKLSQATTQLFQMQI